MCQSIAANSFIGQQIPYFLEKRRNFQLYNHPGKTIPLPTGIHVSFIVKAGNHLA